MGNVYRAEALCQTQRASRIGNLPPEFVRSQQIFQETNAESLQSESLLEVGGDKIFSRALGEPLEHTEACTTIRAVV